jgi:Protein of unknown function with HXXEE motif
MAPSFRAVARLFVLAFAVHVAEEAPGFTAWAKRNASERYTQRDFVRNNALGFVSTAAATAAVIRSDNRTLQMAYYTVVVTQQALFNAVFHAVSTIAFRQYSPGLITSLVNAGLWRRLTRSALAEGRIAERDLPACIVAAGALHAAVVARQVFFLGVSEP